MRVLKTYIPVPMMAICLTLFACAAYGQDLGSSNKLFGGQKKDPAKTTGKTKPKHHSTAAKKRATPKHTAAVHHPKQKPRTEAKTPVKIAPPVAIGPKDNKDKPKPNAAKPAADTPERNAQYDRLTAEGNSAFSRRDYYAADDAYRRAAEVKPGDARARIAAAILYMDLERWEDAERSLRLAVKSDGANWVPYLALSYVMSQPVNAPDLASRYDEAETLAKKAVQLNGTNAGAHDQLGFAIELHGLIGNDAETEYRRAIQLSPNYAPAYAHLARLLRQNRRAAEANAAEKEAADRAKDPSAQLRVASILQSDLRFAESLPLIQRALADDPRNVSGLNMLGRALTATGKYSDAEAALRKSADIDPNGYVPRSLLGQLYMRQRMFDRAESSFSEAAGSAAGFEKRALSNMFETLGDELGRAGDRAGSQRAYKKAASLDPSRRTTAEKRPVSPRH